MKMLKKHGVSILKGTLIVYLFFNLINFVTHMIKVPAIIQADYYFYGAKILLEILICVLINKACIAVKRCEIFMEAIMVLDILEVLISITVVEKTTFIVAVFCVGIALKFILQSFFIWFFYVDSLKYGEQVKHKSREDRFTAIWILVHFFLPLCLTGLGLGIIMVLLPIRGILEFLAICAGSKMIKTANLERGDDMEVVYTYPPALRWSRILFGIALSLSVICFLFFRYSYVEGSRTCEETEQTSASGFTRAVNDHELDYEYLSDSEAENVLQYTVENRLPKWSGFHSEKAGLVNTVTGENTGAIYKERMHFDCEGIAYDNDGHLINYKGEKICAVPEFVSADFSLRWCMSVVISRMLDNNEGVSEFFSGNIDRKSEKFVLSSDPKHIFEDKWGKYFPNGSALYYSRSYDKYGLMSENGEVLIKPIVDYIRYFYDGGMILAEYVPYEYEGTQYSDAMIVYNSKGEQILDMPVRNYYNDDDYHLIELELIGGGDDKTSCYKIMNFDGEMMDGFFSGENGHRAESIEEGNQVKYKRYRDKSLSGTFEWVTFDEEGKIVQ